jgi:2-(1,2-epoxy-1,2-dihydrophenyl)acetyl-CoA isomerase
MTEALIADGPVLLAIEDGIARLRLNRPEASNGLSEALLDGLVEATRMAEEAEGIRCLVLSGEGENFCAGGDVKEFAAKGEGLPDHLRKQTALLQTATASLIRLRAPVVALIQGWAVGGGGLGLACAADLAIGAEGSRYMSGATRVGMAPDAGGSVTVARIVGVRRAMEIFLTNRVLSAAEAFELGILNKVVPDSELEAEGMKLARELANGPTIAFGETKRLVWEGLGRSVLDALPDEAETVSRLSGTEDSLEGLAAVIERRDPEYRGR